MVATTDWIGIYEDKFKKVYDSVKNLESKPAFTKLDKLPQDKRELLCKKYFRLFDISCELLKSYLIYNGIIQSGRLLILRKSYNLEVIEDAQKWINLYFVFGNYKKHSNEKTEKFVIAHLNSDYLKIFDDLNLYIKQEMEMAN